LSRITSLKPYLVPAVLWLLAVGFLVVAEQYDRQSRAMPLLIGRAMVLLATLDILSRSPTKLGHALLKWLNPSALTMEGPADTDRDQWKALGYILGVVAFVCGLIWLGMFVAVPVFVFVSVTAIGRRSLSQAVIATVAVSVFVWILFSLVLGLSLFPGLLFGGYL